MDEDQRKGRKKKRQQKQREFFDHDPEFHDLQLQTANLQSIPKRKINVPPPQSKHKKRREAQKRPEFGGELIATHSQNSRFREVDEDVIRENEHRNQLNEKKRKQNKDFLKELRGKDGAGDQDTSSDDYDKATFSSVEDEEEDEEDLEMGHGRYKGSQMSYQVSAATSQAGSGRNGEMEGKTDQGELTQFNGKLDKIFGPITSKNAHKPTTKTKKPTNDKKQSNLLDTPGVENGPGKANEENRLMFGGRQTNTMAFDAPDKSLKESEQDKASGLDTQKLKKLKTQSFPATTKAEQEKGLNNFGLLNVGTEDTKRKTIASQQSQRINITTDVQDPIHEEAGDKSQQLPKLVVKQTSHGADNAQQQDPELRDLDPPTEEQRNRLQPFINEHLPPTEEQRNRLQPFINEHLADVGDKVKELMKELKIVKNDLRKYREEQEYQEKRNDPNQDSHLKDQMKILIKPIKKRQKTKETNINLYREMVKNQPQEKGEARKKMITDEEIANDSFLRDIEKTMKEYSDPIMQAQKKLKKRQKLNNQDNASNTNSDRNSDQNSITKEEADEINRDKDGMSDEEKSFNASNPQPNSARNAKSNFLTLDKTFVQKQIVSAEIDTDEVVQRFEWKATNPDPSEFLEESKRKQDQLDNLGRRLQKFVSKRNIQYNLAHAFKEWRDSTNDWKAANQNTFNIIRQARLFMQTFFGSSAGDKSSEPQTSNEEKSTDEAQAKDESSGRNKAKQGDTSARNQDQDDDIQAPSREGKQLIPFFFGVQQNK